MSTFRLPRYEVRPSSISRGGVGLVATVRFAAGDKPFRESDPNMRLMSFEEFERQPAATRTWIERWGLGWPDGYWVPVDSDALTLAWFCNHACDGNLGFDRDGVFVALRDIEPGEEITYDYSLVDVITDPILEQCTCGSECCRGRISGLDWRDDDWWGRQGFHAHPIVRQARATYEAARRG